MSNLGPGSKLTIQPTFIHGVDRFAGLYFRLWVGLQEATYRDVLIHSDSCRLGAAPTFVAAISPSLKRIRVGIPLTPYFAGVSGFSSMLTFTTVRLSLYSFASSSSAGAICTHGPHHSAQKSTRTGFSDLMTSASNDESVTLLEVIPYPFIALYALRGAAQSPKLKVVEAYGQDRHFLSISSERC